MKRTALLLAGLLVLALVPVTSAETDTGETTTLTGKFWWNRHNEALEAVFTPAGEGRWDVAFYFEFRGKSHTYRGTADGSLNDGNLSGTVKNESGQRTFKFRGSFDDGTFNGTHAEIGENREIKTGKLTLQHT